MFPEELLKAEHSSRLQTSIHGWKNTFWFRKGSDRRSLGLGTYHLLQSGSRYLQEDLTVACSHSGAQMEEHGEPPRGRFVQSQPSNRWEEHSLTSCCFCRNRRLRCDLMLKPACFMFVLIKSARNSFLFLFWLLCLNQSWQRMTWLHILLSWNTQFRANIHPSPPPPIIHFAFSSSSLVPRLI